MVGYFVFVECVEAEPHYNAVTLYDEFFTTLEEAQAAYESVSLAYEYRRLYQTSTAVKPKNKEFYKHVCSFEFNETEETQDMTLGEIFYELCDGYHPIRSRGYGYYEYLRDTDQL